MIKLCKINKCSRKHFGHGLCNTHYRRWYIHGDTNRGFLSPADRFWRFVDKSSDCWVWTGTKIHKGYGRFTVMGKSIFAHRYSFYLHTGQHAINNVLHSCDNPPCVRPDHLREGTHSENMKDAYERGRKNQKGESHNGAKLTEKDIVEIRRLIATGMQNKDIAIIYKVSRHHISGIKIGRTWTHI